MEHNTPLVLLGPRTTDDSVAIWRLCVANNWPVHRLQGWRVPESLGLYQSPVVIYGEPLFAEAVADQMGLVLLEPSIDWLPSLPEPYLSRWVEQMTLGEARRLTSPAFVKPADGKIFEPKVYATGCELPSDEHVDQEIPVLRSGIVDFRLEIRCFVRDRTIVTLSPYWREDTLAQGADGTWPLSACEEAAARTFANGVLSDATVQMPPACALDVGKLKDGNWAVIEANPCWGAGLYGCDPQQVMLTIQSAILRRNEVTESHRRWISLRRQAG